jgi:hypothetical protein
MKLGTQLVPPAVDKTDAASKTFVERLGGRGAPDLIHCTMSGDHDIVAADVVPFDTIGTSRGLTNDGTDKVGGLKAGRTYYIQANLAIFTAAPGIVTFEIWDVTAAARVGNLNRVNTTTDTGDNSSSSVLSYPFTPEVDTELQIRVVTGTAGFDIDSVYSWFSVIEISGPALSGPLEHLETIDVSVAVQDVTFSNLDSDSDEHYVLYSYIQGDGGATIDIDIRPNAVTTNQGGTKFFAKDATVSGSDAGAVIPLITTVENYAWMETHIQCIAASSVRNFYSHGTAGTGGAENATVQASGGLWDGSTNITSLNIHHDLGADIGAGSRFSLYRLRTQNFPANFFPPGHLDGLKMSFNTVSTVDIAPGTCKDSTGNTRDIEIRSALTADITVSGANGLDTGSEAASTWYALYVIKGASGVASLLSASFTSPTMPVGYDVFRRVGAVRNSSGSAIEDFRQLGAGRDRRVWWDNSLNFKVLTAGASTTYAAVDCSGAIPPSSIDGQFMTELLTPTAGTFLKLKPTGATERIGSYGVGGTSNLRHAPIQVDTDSSQSIDYAISANTVDLWVSGYTDNI